MHSENQQLYLCVEMMKMHLPLICMILYHHEKLKNFGWHTNDSKQMCGYAEHEFFQKMPHKQKGCCGPISAMMASMESGQWYKTQGMHQDCVGAFVFLIKFGN